MLSTGDMKSVISDVAKGMAEVAVLGAKMGGASGITKLVRKKNIFNQIYTLPDINTNKIFSDAKNVDTQSPTTTLSKDDVSKDKSL